MADKPYLFDHPEQKRAYHRFCDSLPSNSMEDLIEMMGKLYKDTENLVYLEAVIVELGKRVADKIKELQ